MPNEQLMEKGLIRVDEEAMEKKLKLEASLIWKHRTALVWNNLIAPWLIPMCLLAGGGVALWQYIKLWWAISKWFVGYCGGTWDPVLGTLFCFITTLIHGGTLAALSEEWWKIKAAFSRVKSEWDVASIRKKLERRS